MAKVKLNLAGRTPEGKVELGRTLIECLTGNTDFPTPDPTLVEFEAKVDAVDNKITELKAARAHAATLLTQLNDLEKEYDQILNDLAAYVEKTSGGDAAKIQSAGMSVRSEPTPLSELPQVSNLSLSAGDNDGELDGVFDRVAGAKSYEVQSCSDPITPTGWVHRDTFTKSSFTIEGLTSGTRTWVRVRAVGPKRIKGPWSDPAVKVVP